MILSKLIRLDEFIDGIKNFLNTVNVDFSIKEELKQIVCVFSFYNKFWEKYSSVFKKLEISSHFMKRDKLYNNSKTIKNIYWLIFVMAHFEILEQTTQIIDTMALLSAIFIDMLKNPEVISNFLIEKNQDNSLSNELIKEEVYKILNIKKLKNLNTMYKNFQTFVKNLQEKNILNTDWNIPSKLYNSYQNLKLNYQEELNLNQIDLTFFLTDRANTQMTPFLKQAHLYRKNKFTLPNHKMKSQRILNYDNMNFSNKTNKAQKKKMPTVIKSNINFSKMQKSPYQMKNLVQATPMTTAMELYYWLNDKYNLRPIYKNLKLIDDEIENNKELTFFFDNLNAQNYCRIIKDCILKFIDNIIDKEIELNSKKKKKYREERKEIMINFYFSILEDFIRREKKAKNLNLKKIILDINFHKSLIVCIAETVFFILNISHVDIIILIKITQLEAFEFYKENFFVLNYENLIPLPLKKHFLDIETYFLSFLFWKDKTLIENNLLEKKEMEKIFERLLYYMSSQINLLTKALDLDESLTEKIWTFFKKIFMEERKIFLNRFLEQIIMCSVYALCKIHSQKVKFQEIISKYQKISSFSKSLFQSIIYKCKIKEKENNDIIHFYNEIFVIELRNQILDSGKTTSLEDLDHTFNPFSKPHKHFTNNNQNLNVINSPLSKLTSTPFTYYNKNMDFGKSFKSPTSMMMKMCNKKFPKKSKKLLDFNKKDFRNKGEGENFVIPFDKDQLDQINNQLKKFL